MAIHTSDQKAWIVRQLAAYVTPETVVEEFKRQFKDTACDLADVTACDRRSLAPDWQTYFDHFRETFLDAPTADKRVRIAELHRMYVNARDRNSIELAAKLLLQIATERGDVGGKSGAGGTPGADTRPVTAIEMIIVDPKPLPESDE